MDNNINRLSIDYVSLLINIYCDYLNTKPLVSQLNALERNSELELLEIKVNKLSDLSLKYELNDTNIDISYLCCMESIQILDQFILKYQIRNETRANVEYLINKRNNICKRAKYLKQKQKQLLN
jgi:hypothetical protein